MDDDGKMSQPKKVLSHSPPRSFSTLRLPPLSNLAKYSEEHRLLPRPISELRSTCSSPSPNSRNGRTKSSRQLSTRTTRDPKRVKCIVKGEDSEMQQTEWDWVRERGQGETFRIDRDEGDSTGDETLSDSELGATRFGATSRATYDYQSGPPYLSNHQYHSQHMQQLEEDEEPGDGGGGGGGEFLNTFFGLDPRSSPLPSIQTQQQVHSYSSDTPRPYSFPPTAAYQSEAYSFPPSFSFPFTSTSSFALSSNSPPTTSNPLSPLLLPTWIPRSSTTCQQASSFPPLFPLPQWNSTPEEFSEQLYDASQPSDSGPSSWSSHDSQLDSLESQPSAPSSIFPISSSSYELPTPPSSFRTPGPPSPTLYESRRHSWPLSSSFDFTLLEPRSPFVPAQLQLRSSPIIPPPSSLQTPPPPSFEKEPEWLLSREDNEMYQGALALSEINPTRGIQAREEGSGSIVPKKRNELETELEGEQGDEEDAGERGDTTLDGEIDERNEAEGLNGDHDGVEGTALYRGSPTVENPGAEEEEQIQVRRRSTRKSNPPRASLVASQPTGSGDTSGDMDANDVWKSDTTFWAPFEQNETLLNEEGESVDFSESIANPSSFFWSDELENWLTYRRNFLFFDVSITFDSPVSLSSLHTSTSDSRVAYLEVKLEAVTYPRGSPVEISQFGTSRSLAASSPVGPRRLFPLAVTRSDTGHLIASTYSTQFSRLQYRASTSKHGTEDRDNFFLNVVTLVAVHQDGDETNLGSWKSAKLVVRGRSPGNFEKSKKKREGKSSSSSSSSNKPARKRAKLSK
ncbi:uncharacterized protein JCM6883_006037 [Sporobolomyces salmoneus]|uniref:uncharacterized protein n=1 Tax=Sporobolomyces salmoneus TaxID=183962 RepID=UPI0031704382